MTQREAKREACGITARMLDNFLDVGAADANTATEKDADRLAKAIQELRDEMDRRARS